MNLEILRKSKKEELHLKSNKDEEIDDVFKDSRLENQKGDNHRIKIRRKKNSQHSIFQKKEYSEW